MRASVTYTWAAELVPTQRLSAVSTTLTTFDSLTMAILCFFLLFGSRDINWLLYASTLLSTICLFISVILIPESPKWLIVVGDKKRAIDAFHYMAWFNGSE